MRDRNEQRDHARATLRLCSVDVGANFHTLPPSTVCDLLEYADKEKYRKPRNANGSRGRYYHAMLQRRATWEER